MTATYFFTILINGLRLGSVYALIAIGAVLAVSASKKLRTAQ